MAVGVLLESLELQSSSGRPGDRPYTCSRKSSRISARRRCHSAGDRTDAARPCSTDRAGREFGDSRFDVVDVRPLDRRLLNGLRVRLPAFALSEHSNRHRPQQNQQGAQTNDVTNVIGRLESFARAPRRFELRSDNPPNRTSGSANSRRLLLGARHCRIADLDADDAGRRHHRTARQPGPRTTRPGFAPVCSPPCSTCTPLTKTCIMPVEYWCGLSNVAWS